MLGEAARLEAGKLVKWLWHSAGGLQISISESTNFCDHLHDPSPTRALKMDGLNMWLAYYGGGITEATRKSVETAGNIFNTGNC